MPELMGMLFKMKFSIFYFYAGKRPIVPAVQSINVGENFQI
jgi:hypothetical protein